MTTAKPTGQRSLDWIKVVCVMPLSCEVWNSAGVVLKVKLAGPGGVIWTLALRSGPPPWSLTLAQRPISSAVTVTALVPLKGIT